MNFKFQCPNCDYLITETDFKKNEKILANLKSIFDEHKNNYLKILEENIKNKLEEQYEILLEQEITKKENEYIKTRQKEKSQTDAIITNLQNTIYNKNVEFDKILIEKESEFNKIKNEEIEKLNKIINEQNIKLSNYKVNLEKTIIEEKNKISIDKQKEISALYENIFKLNNIIENNKIILEKTLIEKENEYNIEIKKMYEKYQKDIITRNKEIEELKIANLTNKVIQNKVKGENFENDVFGELLKVFIDDTISKITSQEKKADYLQEIIVDHKYIGKIVYEVKNAEWSNAWEKKLIEDAAKQNSKYGILVATSFNKKYPGIPFKKSNENPNIYLCDADSFIFVGQIIRDIIKMEYKLELQKNTIGYNEKIKNFNNWKNTQLPRYIKLFDDNFKRIEQAEKSILKNVDGIRIGREKIQNNALKNIRQFIESFDI